MNSEDFTDLPFQDFRKESPKDKETYLDFKKRMNELLASQPQDGISNVKGPIMDTILSHPVTFSDFATQASQGTRRRPSKRDPRTTFSMKSGSSILIPHHLR